MSTELLQLYSQNHWLADGSQTIWDFTFADGYIDEAYVKAYQVSPGGATETIPVTHGMFIGEFQLEIDPPVPDGYTLVIYRDTPKDEPLVDFADGARVSETSLDLIARQAVHIAAEVLDGSGVSLITDEIGFRAMQQKGYTGSSIVLTVDGGRSHYKTDATAVTVPNTLPVEFLTTIINDNSSEYMNVAFDDAIAVQQGSDDFVGSDTWTLAPYNSLTIMKVADGRWFIAGKVS